MEVAQEQVSWQALVLPVLNCHGILSDICYCCHHHHLENVAYIVVLRLLAINKHKYNL
jgi:hypothetical protein